MPTSLQDSAAAAVISTAHLRLKHCYFSAMLSNYYRKDLQPHGGTTIGPLCQCFKVMISSCRRDLYFGTGKKRFLVGS